MPIKLDWTLECEIKESRLPEAFLIMDILMFVIKVYFKSLVYHVEWMSSYGGQHWKEVLNYWFEPGAEKKWFNGGEAVDNEIKERFGNLVEQVLQGGLRSWELEPKPSLALIILADQFTRNIFRGTARAFDGDARAIKITRKFLERKTHDHLRHSLNERCFIYLPLEHSEEAADQELFSQLSQKVAKDADGTEYAEQMKFFVEIGKRHKELIDGFGRYPQRNKVLGRASTAEEKHFLLNLPDRYKW